MLFRWFHRRHVTGIAGTPSIAGLIQSDEDFIFEAFDHIKELARHQLRYLAIPGDLSSLHLHRRPFDRLIEHRIKLDVAHCSDQRGASII